MCKSLHGSVEYLHGGVKATAWKCASGCLVVYKWLPGECLKEAIRSYEWMCASYYVVLGKRLCGGGPYDFSVSPSPLVPEWAFELGLTGLGLGLGGLGTMGLGFGDRA